MNKTGLVKRLKIPLIGFFLITGAIWTEKTRDYMNLPLRPMNLGVGGQLGYNLPTQAAAMMNPAYLGYGDQNAFFTGGLFNNAISGYFFDGALFSPFGGLAFSANYLQAEDKNFALGFAYGSFLSRRVATGLSLTPRYVVSDASQAFAFGIDPALLFDSKWHKSFGETDGFGIYSPSVFARTQNLNIPIGERSLLANPSMHVGLTAGFYQSSHFNWAGMVSTYGTERFDRVPVTLGMQMSYRWAMVSLGYGMNNYSTTGNGVAVGLGAQLPLSFGDTFFFYNLAFANGTRNDLHSLTAGVRLGGIDSDPPEVDFTSEGRYFSPNSDGIRDTISFTASASDKSPIVYYELRIRDLKGTVVYKQKSDERVREKEFSWSLFFRSFVSPRSRADIPRKFSWNGRLVQERKKAVKDNLFEDETIDAPLADGVYSYEFWAIDEKNNESRHVTGEVIIDTRAPAASVELGDDLISPNGDGRRDILSITQDTSPADTYVGEIIAAGGEKIRTFTWPEKAPTRVDFDGRRDNGDIAEEGLYRYRLTGRDSAGNQKVATSENFYISRRVDAVFLKSSAAGLNPTQKQFAEVGFTPSVEFPQGYLDGEILLSRRCSNKADDLVFRIPVAGLPTDKKKLPAKRAAPGRQEVAGSTAPAIAQQSPRSLPSTMFSWHGEAASQSRAADGIYCVVFRARYENGNAPESPPIKVVLDTTAPDLEITADLTSREFTPDGDGENEEQAFRLYARDLSPIASYSVAIREILPGAVPGSIEVRAFQGQGEIPTTLYWDGKTESGMIADSLTQYEYTLTATDAYGNKQTTAPRRFETGVLASPHGNGFLVRIPHFDLEEPVTERLDAAYKLITRYPKYKIKVETHAGGGGIEKNLRLTEAAARKVYEYFLDKGIAPERLTYQGFGDSAPIYNARAPQAVKNKRLDLLLSR